ADEVDRFQTLVNDLLELARSDQPTHREPTEVTELASRLPWRSRRRALGDPTSSRAGPDERGGRRRCEQHLRSTHDPR
ncbi:MAG: hypothetical protein ABW022_06085, partial [Actinoplanes sp.]